MATTLNRLSNTLAAIEALEPNTLVLDINTGIIIKRQAFIDTPIANIDTALSALELYLQSLEMMRVVPIPAIYTLFHPEEPYTFTETDIIKAEASGWSAILTAITSIAAAGYISFNIGSINDQWKVSIGIYELQCKSGVIEVFENGIATGSTVIPIEGQLIEIARTGTQVSYYVNNVLILDSSIASEGDLIVTTNIYTEGATLYNVVISNTAKE